MVSPLECELLLDEGWELALQQEAALAGDDLWADLPPAPTPAPADLDSLLDWSVQALEACEPREVAELLVHHDCMWAGQCLDKLHPGNEPGRAPSPPASPPAGRSLLRVQHAPAAAPPPRPDTPLSLDDDSCPPVFRHHVDLASTTRRLLQPPQPPQPPQPLPDSVAADHSYTQRPQRGSLDHLGVQTPSDSEEDVDVETVGGAGDGGAKLLPGRPAGAPEHGLLRSAAAALGPRRRRALLADAPAGRKRGRRAGRPPRRAPDSDSEAEGGEGGDVERRSLHNDMERMRRIGLKNLFDELKAQVPSTRDKARAPKVAILREAALLCRRLAAEEREREALRRTQARLFARVRRLRLELARRSHARAASP